MALESDAVRINREAMMPSNSLAKSPFPNPWTTPARIVGWASIGCLAWTAVSVFLLARIWNARQGYHGVLAVILYGGWPAGGLCVILLLTYIALGSIARRTDKIRQAISNGQTLIHWSYPPEYWQQFRRSALKAENARRRTLRFATGSFIILPLVVVAIVACLPPARDRSIPIIISGVCGGLMIVSTIVLIVGTHIDSQRRQRLSTPHDSYVTTLGGYANGDWILWGTTNHRLHDIRIHEGEGSPAFLEFIIQSGQVFNGHRVLIPVNRIPLARKIAATVAQSPNAKGGDKLNSATTVMQVLTMVLRDFI